MVGRSGVARHGRLHYRGAVDIREASRDYERWLAERVPLVRRDLDLKHRLMRQDVFSFLRATFYRWAQLWADVCEDLAEAPAVLAVADLQVENFGTWRDAEGRLIRGSNDFDEVVTLPYTQDLVRLGTSALLAVEESRLTLSARRGCESILAGYTEALRAGGGAAVLAERYRWLRDLAVARLKDQRPFWDHMRSLRTVSGRVDPRVRRLLAAAMTARALEARLAARPAGAGSLGRLRVVALANWLGGMVAREAKPLTASAWLWARHGPPAGPRPPALLRRAVRVPEPL